MCRRAARTATRAARSSPRRPYAPWCQTLACGIRHLSSMHPSGAHAQAFGVDGWLSLDPRRAADADHLDLEPVVDVTGELGGDVAPRQRHRAVVRVATAGDPADHPIVVPDRLVADHIGRVAGVDIELEHHQRALGSAAVALGLDRLAADVVVLELEIPVHAGFEWCVDRAVLAEPRAEVLLEPHRDQGAETEQLHAVRLTGRPDQVEQVALVLGRTPDLVAEVTGV